jgi:hypothetical protein
VTLKKEGAQFECFSIKTLAIANFEQENSVSEMKSEIILKQNYFKTLFNNALKF